MSNETEAKEYKFPSKVVSYPASEPRLENDEAQMQSIFAGASIESKSLVHRTMARMSVAIVCCAFALGFVVLSAIFGAGGALIFAVFAILFLPSWSLLPFIRESRLFGSLYAVVWFALGAYLHGFGMDYPSGGGFVLWALATVVTIACLAVRPPSYFPKYLAWTKRQIGDRPKY